jgi:phosphoglycerate kinase
MKSIKELKNFKGKTFLLRAGFDVPIEHGKVVNDRRIRLLLPTIKYLSARGPLVILSHQGRPAGKKINDLSLRPVLPVLEKLLKKKILFAESCLGEKTEKMAKTLRKGEILLLENVRFHPEEEKNDSKFAKELASLGNIYVNDAFPNSHRAHASIVGIPKYLPHYAGFQFEKEIKSLSRVLHSPKHPFLFILGGAKFETKLPLIKKFLSVADNVFIGGAILNDFLKIQGLETGISHTSSENYGLEKIYRNKKIILPTKIVVKTAEGKFVERKTDKILSTDNQVDLSGDMISLIEPYLKKARLILWNGPFNKYESRVGIFSRKFLKLLARSKAEIIIGGGDTVATIAQMKMEDKFTFVSTGGGATLEFLAQGTLPGINALK